jgi:RNA polymerase sigma-70 factor, ECF subfamily
MTSGNSQGPELLAMARRGDRDALGKLLEHYRAYLRVLAQRHLDGNLGARIDASDLVQQTCLSAHRNFANFAGDDRDFLAWLRNIHEQNLRNVLRDHVAADKRAVGRETSGDQLGSIAALTSSPSQRLMQSEAAVQLARCLEQLPADQCNAVRLRHLEGWTIRDIASEMERSEQAVAGLLKRGMQQLRELLPATNEE